MKWLLVAVGALLALGALVYVIGGLLPQSHAATVRTRIGHPPAEVYAALEDVRASPAWRSDLREVEVISGPGEPLRWRENGKYGSITFEREDARPGQRLVGRIADTSQGFGGRWVFQLAPAADGTELTVTEEGEVYSPLFRFVSRFVFGHYGTLESYVRDLGRRFGEEVRIERVHG